MVAAPSAQQNLAAHPLLRLCRVPGPGHTAHHMVQVLHILGWDWLVVVSILRRKEEALVSAGLLREVPDADSPALAFSTQRAATFLLMLPNTEP